jgi:hypothetical protein
MRHLNAYNQKHLPIFAPKGFDSIHALDVADPGFEARVRDHQRRLKLTVDGSCGPATIAALARESWEAHGGLLFGPRAIPVSVKNGTYLTEPWLGKTPAAPRTRPVTLGVLHWDVTNSSRQTEAVLARRDCAIHFLIDADGTLYQSHNATLVRGRHAGTEANLRSIACDLNNPVLTPGSPRRAVQDIRVHGVVYKNTAQYWPEQLTSLKALMVAAEEGLGLPQTYPDQNTVIANAHLINGWVGHLHLINTKYDPGTKAMLGL